MNAAVSTTKGTTRKPCGCGGGGAAPAPKSWGAAPSKQGGCGCGCTGCDACASGTCASMAGPECTSGTDEATKRPGLPAPSCLPGRPRFFPGQLVTDADL